MSSNLTRLDVLRIASLARLELSESEIETFTPQLDHILEYADAVRQVDTAGVPPTSHPFVSATRGREDVHTDSLDRDKALANAPDAIRDPGLFRVPKVL